MAKTGKSVFFCQECGYESAKWMGQCPACHAWNTFVEEKVTEGAAKNARGIRDGVPKSRPVRLSEIESGSDERYLTGIGELDRVLGGGIVHGSLVLIGGDPGIGKSTLLLQVCLLLSAKGVPLLYVSGEESARQIKMRAERLGGKDAGMEIFCETDLDAIESVIEQKKPGIVVIDSIQTMYTADVSAAPGSVSQVREACGRLLRIAKGSGISIFIVGHVTKEGAVAGPRVLEHMVDTVLYFEGDHNAAYRILRAVKNRFGSTNEIGVFEMQQDGLREVENPSEFMLHEKTKETSGVVVTCQVEGSRAVLLEIQALVTRSGFGMPRRTAAGFDYNRMNLLIAVLEKRTGCDFTSSDAYINVAGGIKIFEPAGDLAIALSLLSGQKDLVIGDDVMVFGEVGLAGEIRAVPQAALRIAEAKKLGFHTVILPRANMRGLGDAAGQRSAEGIRLIPCETLREAAAAIRKGQ